MLWSDMPRALLQRKGFNQQVVGCCNAAKLYSTLSQYLTMYVSHCSGVRLAL